MKRLAVVAGMVGLVVTALPASPWLPGLAVSAENPVEDARRATEEASFSGVMVLTWSDSNGVHEQRVTVEAGSGAFAVHGGNQVMALAGSQRLVHHPESGWDLLWAPRVAPGRRPDTASKYQTAVVPGGVVAGRSTNRVEIRQDGVVRERLYVDSETGVLLRREQYDPAGVAVTRAVGFETLSLATPEVRPAMPSRPADRSPRPHSGASHLPLTLPDGYHRLGVYERGDVVQAVYSDGIYDLSVFAQTGDLREGKFRGAATPVAIGSTSGWRYTWPGGQLVMWDVGRTTYAAVSDAPADQVLRAVQGISASGGSPSLLTKLRRMCRGLVQPISD